MFPWIRRWRALVRFLWLGAVGLWAACTPFGSASTTVVLPTPTGTATSTATPTQVPFPPTATPTPLPPTLSPSPTPNPLAGASTLLVEERFDQPRWWQAARSVNGTYAVAQGMLTLSVPQGPGYSAALRREPQVTDFVLQVTARPRFCQGEDAYGVVLRADAKGVTYYRVGVTCAGDVFAEYVDGSTVTVLLEPQVLGLPTGPFVSVPLTVRLKGRWLEVFVYGHALGKVMYRGRYQGLVGAFVRARTENAVAVDFLTWQVWSLEGSP